MKNKILLIVTVISQFISVTFQFKDCYFQDNISKCTKVFRGRLWCYTDKVERSWNYCEKDGKHAVGYTNLQMSMRKKPSSCKNSLYLEKNHNYKVKNKGQNLKFVSCFHSNQKLIIGTWNDKIYSNEVIYRCIRGKWVTKKPILGCSSPNTRKYLAKRNLRRKRNKSSETILERYKRKKQSILRYRRYLKKRASMILRRLKNRRRRNNGKKMKKWKKKRNKKKRFQNKKKNLEMKKRKKLPNEVAYNRLAKWSKRNSRLSKKKKNPSNLRKNDLIRKKKLKFRKNQNFEKKRIVKKFQEKISNDIDRKIKESNHQVLEDRLNEIHEMSNRNEIDVKEHSKTMQNLSTNSGKFWEKDNKKRNYQENESKLENDNKIQDKEKFRHIDINQMMNNHLKMSQLEMPKKISNLLLQSTNTTKIDLDELYGKFVTQPEPLHRNRAPRSYHREEIIPMNQMIMNEKTDKNEIGTSLSTLVLTSMSNGYE
ncbi:hypothetical protein SNEBB_006244 [Seison nebaliae]|nr:hypothetical protein SNEBB_006244 [Seison nebaliae]